MYRKLIKWMTYILIVLVLVLLFIYFLDENDEDSIYSIFSTFIFLIYLSIYLCLYFIYFLLSCCNDNKKYNRIITVNGVSYVENAEDDDDKINKGINYLSHLFFFSHYIPISRKSVNN
ncbi:hypothetical protein A0H76_903 [Hepatospora eriocheir]|uniref:Uncharacterized protein n=1 Tax=Hepatospora eriocheir TaxID=1081669 RepID=A0A1X0QI26_9MICR|nr:hypothetical protein A0H76_903 [Hepatospora eriocheir]